MTSGLYAVARAVMDSLLPGPWAIGHQAALGFVVAYMMLKRSADYRAAPRDLRVTAGMVGGGGAVAFAFVGMMGSPVAILLAGCLMWAGTARLLERHALVPRGSSQRVTGMICLSTWLLWLIVGAAISLVRPI